MKIAISVEGSGMESRMDQRFGRAAGFVFVETDTMTFEAADNAGAASGGGAGIAAAQMIADRDVQAVITGNVGPNAMNVLKAADIAVYKGIDGSVRENAEALKRGTLSQIGEAVPAHFGMGAKP